jgi:hypothetical protein
LGQAGVWADDGRKRRKKEKRKEEEVGWAGGLGKG